MGLGRTSRWRLGVAGLVVLAALGLHRHVCEWRSQRYPLGEAAAAEGRLLVSLWRRDHPTGNAVRWDAVHARNTPRIRAWGRCFDRVHGTLKAAERAARDACLAGSRFPVHDAATRIVALGECEHRRFGRVRHAEAIHACLEAEGHAPGSLPRWTFDLLGPRYEGAYRERFGLWAETVSRDDRVDRRRGWRTGVALPFLLLALAAALVARRGPDTATR